MSDAPRRDPAQQDAPLAETVPRTMRALHVDAEGRLELRTGEPVPVAGDGDALVRVLRAGVCATDHALAFDRYKGGYAGVLGHEFVGVVVRGPRALLGERVVGEINVRGCGDDGALAPCAACASGARS